ncbi:GNAT family N-acetyltransferase [Flocculibacter collagenilyticus]|uniref:GNAT family N-acetyltransferase n=1 Tax=Flocculibacter collagenilyticus TaxID=2744479 RepID=UPI0018F39D4B|nr:GNAT family N-acetyltransferase [Flocculibacter collagenilyticus]
MTITLQPVSQKNYEDVCDLEVAKDQEDYVAENMWSIVESTFNEGYETRAIYRDDKVVGFFMWVKESIEKISIWRFMVDSQHQNQGIGRKALTIALDEIKQVPKLKEIEICYQPDNPVAGDFYGSFGFIEVGMDEDDDDMLAIIKL